MALVPLSQDGELTVKIIRCTDLPAKDRDGKSDPYVIFGFADKKGEFLNKDDDRWTQRTPTIPKNLNPEWKDHEKTMITDDNTAAFRLEVFDKDKGSRDDFIGSYQLEAVNDGDEIDYEVALQQKKKKGLFSKKAKNTGTITFKLQWLSPDKAAKLRDQKEREEWAKTLRLVLVGLAAGKLQPIHHDFFTRLCSDQNVAPLVIENGGFETLVLAIDNRPKEEPFQFVQFVMASVQKTLQYGHKPALNNAWDKDLLSKMLEIVTGKVDLPHETKSKHKATIMEKRNIRDLQWHTRAIVLLMIPDNRSDLHVKAAEECALFKHVVTQVNVYRAMGDKMSVATLLMFLKKLVGQIPRGDKVDNNHIKKICTKMQEDGFIHLLVEMSKEKEEDILDDDSAKSSPVMGSSPLIKRPGLSQGSGIHMKAQSAASSWDTASSLSPFDKKRQSSRGSRGSRGSFDEGRKSSSILASDITGGKKSNKANAISILKDVLLLHRQNVTAFAEEGGRDWLMKELSDSVTQGFNAELFELLKSLFVAEGGVTASSLRPLVLEIKTVFESDSEEDLYANDVAGATDVLRGMLITFDDSYPLILILIKEYDMLKLCNSALIKARSACTRRSADAITNNESKVDEEKSLQAVYLGAAQLFDTMYKAKGNGANDLRAEMKAKMRRLFKLMMMTKEIKDSAYARGITGRVLGDLAVAKTFE
eukprot:TRINITY_DN2512_c0_g1_i1.p1 TRINITY_DN2512_c0_g1~~TRINITY_DN2512_c0_g1_i1.p1  ORF type:complete len:703 (+),score=201.56 TRINITY_DN2512_c0_g1_i1:114-2222(+)